MNDAAPPYLPGEDGFPLPDASSPTSGLPPGGGKYAIPHFYTFAGKVNLSSRSYRWGPDEALKAGHQDALAWRRDPVVYEALRARQMPTAQLPWHLEARDEDDDVQQAGVKHLTEIIQEIPNFQTLKMQALEALWYGRYGIGLTTAYDYSAGHRRLVIQDHLPINGDKLVFRWSGEVGIKVHATYPGTKVNTDKGMVHFFTPEERECVLVHKHECEDADYDESEYAGAVHGVGIRSRIHWWMWLKSQALAWMMDFLERVGAGGFTIYFYEAGNEASMTEVETAAEKQWRNNAILFPRYRDNPDGGPGIMRIEPGQAGAALLQNLITEYFDTVIRRLILGQSLSAEAAGTGLGSGVAEFHEATLNRILKYDAVNLQESLTHQLVRLLWKYNTPAIPMPRFCFDVDKPNAVEYFGAAKLFYEMGGALDEDSLRSIGGLEKPKPGAPVLSQLQSMSPQVAGSMPQGVPIQGQPGPQVPQGGPQGQPQPGGPAQQAMMQMRRKWYRPTTNGRHPK